MRRMRLKRAVMLLHGLTQIVSKADDVFHTDAWVSLRDHVGCINPVHVSIGVARLQSLLCFPGNEIILLGLKD